MLKGPFLPPIKRDVCGLYFLSDFSSQNRVTPSVFNVPREKREKNVRNYRRRNDRDFFGPHQTSGENFIKNIKKIDTIRKGYLRIGFSCLQLRFISISIDFLHIPYFDSDFEFGGVKFSTDESSQRKCRRVITFENCQHCESNSHTISWAYWKRKIMPEIVHHLSPRHQITKFINQLIIVFLFFSFLGCLKSTYAALTAASSYYCNEKFQIYSTSISVNYLTFEFI